MRSVFALLTAALLSGCAPNAGAGYGSSSANYTPPSVRVKDDQYSPRISYEAVPVIESGSIPALVRSNSPYSMTSLVASRNRDGTDARISAVVVVMHSAGWSRFSEARDAAASALPLSQGIRDVNCSGSRYGGCTFTEGVSVRLPVEALQAAAQSYNSFTFKIFGNTLSPEVSIPAAHIRALLTELQIPLTPQTQESAQTKPAAPTTQSRRRR